MCPSFSTTPFTNLLDNLTQMEGWLRGRKVKIEDTRFEKIFLILKDIVQSSGKGEFQKLLDEYGHMVLWTALSEAAMFVNVYEKIRRHSRAAFHLRTIRAITTGPFHSWDEKPDGGSKHGRNFLFELETAARFTVPGIKITGYDDVDFTIDKVKFNVQCKRLHSVARIAPNIEKAVTQIQKKIGGDSRKRGLIALNIDKIVGIESLYFPTTDPALFGNRLGELVDSFRRQYRHLWQKLPDLRILGALIFVHGLCIYERESEGDMIVTGKQVDMDIIPTDVALQLSDYRLAEKIGQKLKDNS